MSDEFWLDENTQDEFAAFNDFIRGERGPEGPEGREGLMGPAGKSAYQQAVDGGFTGTEAEFNAMLVTFPQQAQTAMASALRATTYARRAEESADQAAASAAHASELVDTLPDDYEDLLQDTAKTMQTIESTAVGPASIVTFDASVAGMPLKGLTVNIEPVQSGSGDPSPDNVRPFTALTGCKLHHTGVSLIGGDAFVGNTFSKSANVYRLSYNGSSLGDRASAYADVSGIPAGRYTLAMLNPSYPAGTEVNVRRRTAGNLVTMGTIISSGAVGRRTYDIPENTTALQLYIIPGTMSLNDSITMDDIVLVRESDTPEPYTGNTYNITFPSEAGAVYGGTLDMVNGVLTVDRVGVKIKDIDWTYTANYERFQAASSVLPFSPKAAPSQYSTPDGLMCECYQIHAAIGMEDKNIAITNNGSLLLKDTTYTTQANLKAAVGENLIVYALASPIVYDLADISDVLTIGDTNNIWANRGDVTVTYGAYLETVKAYADQFGDSILSAIAPLESTYTASRAYTVGSFLFVGTKFYKVTAAIASGDTITPDTNVTQTTVAEQLMALAANA